jgi:FkbM family methyltransferase
MPLTALKRRLVGTHLGRMIARGRELWEMWQTLRKQPEQGGMLSQEACVKLLLPALCDPAAGFLDVGAHIGSVIADVRRHHPEIRVTAIEAVPEKARQLARKFPEAAIHACAVGPVEGHVKFFVDAARPGYSSLAAGQGEGRVEITVPMRRLDDIIPETVRLDMIKLDVEGAELGALRGANEVFRRCRPFVLFESVTQGEAMGFPPGALYDWFAERDYVILVPNRVAHDGPALTRDGFVESHFYPFRTRNYFAVPAERRIEARDRARRALGIMTG